MQDEAGFALGPNDKMRPRNDAIVGLLSHLVNTTDPFELYLCVSTTSGAYARSKAILLEKSGERMAAIQCLVHSCTIFPYNWSAWLKIAVLVERADEVRYQVCHPVLTAYS